MIFNISLLHVGEAVGPMTTHFDGSIYVNGVEVTGGQHTGLGTDRDSVMMELIVEEIERQLGRPLTPDESWGLDDLEDLNGGGSGEPRPGMEYRVEVGEEPGGGEENPRPDHAEVLLSRGAMDALLLLVRQVGLDDPDAWGGGDVLREAEAALVSGRART